jgi:hypothetical protein
MIDTTVGHPVLDTETDAERPESATTWSAIIGGAVAAAAITLIVFSLGVGLGLTGISPWPGASASATTLTVGAAIWLVVMQWISSGVGGYIAGRLRTKAAIHTDEVHFRDTAHGFLAWALATLLVVTVLSAAMAIGAVTGAAAVGPAAGAAAGAAGANASNQPAGGSGAANPIEYRTDALFRATGTAGAGTATNQSGDTRGEALRILARSVRTGDLPASDRSYLADMVVARTGMSRGDAEKRVDEVVASVKDDAQKLAEAADKARKASAGLSILVALSLVVGAFIGCVAGAYGGHHRDEYA